MQIIPSGIEIARVKWTDASHIRKNNVLLVHKSITYVGDVRTPFPRALHASIIFVFYSRSFNEILLASCAWNRVFKDFMSLTHVHALGSLNDQLYLDNLWYFSGTRVDVTMVTSRMILLTE